MKLSIAAGLVASLPFALSQSLTVTGTRVATDTLAASETARVTNSALVTATNVPQGSACAAVSSILAEQSGPPYIVAASLANECQESAPIVREDALRLIDGIVAGLEFQSDVGHLANPPEGYLLAGVDLFREIQQIRDDVDSGTITSEIAFERNMSAVFGKAQDGHLNFAFDGIGVFIYQRQFSLVSVSSDGSALPSIYLTDELINYQQNGGSEPSAVTQVNGQDVTDFLNELGQNISYGALQDPDALYNQQFYVLNAGTGGSDSLGLFALSRNYVDAETTLTFANDSTATAPNLAVFNTNLDFTGLSDGASYYNLFCNATYKRELLLGSSSGVTKRADMAEKREMQWHHRPVNHDLVERQVRIEKRQTSPTSGGIPGYPSPIAISEDLSLSGYFLDSVGFEDTAVLVLQVMSQTAPASFQSELTNFLNQCRSQGKTRLILDLQGNPGGTISLGYDVFKQLFPDIFPYGAGNLRAQEGLDTLGTFYTNFTSQLYAEQPNNVTLLAANNYYIQYSAEAYAGSNGSLFESWDQLYGPVQAGPDNFTNLIRWNINDTNFNLAVGNIVVSGFGNNTEIAPSPFTSENIVVLTDGRCASTCGVLTHLLKYQGKVKQVTMGGRPSTGAMQAVGGVKGSQVYQYYRLSLDAYIAYQTANLLGYTDQMAAIEDSSILGPILNDSDYVILRGANWGIPPAALNDFTFNFQNNIAEGDESYTPLQFVYEAADCRLWFQPQHYGDIRFLWNTVAAQAFGLNNTEVFSLCVEGSTNAPSSLSGNATLFNNGTPTNVTEFQEPRNDGDGSSGGSGSGNDNSGGRMMASSIATIVAITAAVMML